MNASKRRVSALILVAPALAALSACGFRLRGAAIMPFASLFSGFAEGSALGREFNRAMTGNNVKVIDVASDKARADVVLDVLTDTREKSVVSLNASGQVREFQLRMRLKFRLRTQAGRDLIEDTELLATRDISFNESAVLAKEAEEGLLFRDMQSDLVQQLIRRLSAVRLANAS